MSLSREQQVRQIFEDLGFQGVGFARLERPLSLDFYKQWLDQGMAADMSYLHDHLEVKSNPEQVLGHAGSAIVLTKDYVTQGQTHPWPVPPSPLPIARYARGQDYHHRIQGLLHQGIQRLQQEFSDASFLPFVDSGPVLERDLAYRAGLGWVGKNTLVMDEKRGSFSFLASIYTTLQLEAQVAAADRCGTCSRCIDACPTGALVQPRKLDARKCISYWTIEAKALPPEELRPKLDLYFGCDICQDVCPWNSKILKTEKTLTENRADLIQELRWILGSSHKAIEKKWKGSPLGRARPWAHKRNSILVAANKGLNELTPDIEGLVEDRRLGPLAIWALGRLQEVKTKP